MDQRRRLWAQGSICILFPFLCSCIPSAAQVDVGNVKRLPSLIPIGTPIPASAKFPKGKFVIALLSGCQNCTTQALHLAANAHPLPKVIVTDRPEVRDDLLKEWPKAPVVVDADHAILPPPTYAVTPQLFLVDHQAIVDKAIGAIQGSEKWDEWTK